MYIYIYIYTYIDRCTNTCPFQAEDSSRESLEAAGVPVGAGGHNKLKINRSHASTHDKDQPTSEYTTDQNGRRRNDRLTVKDAVAAPTHYRWIGR